MLGLAVGSGYLVAGVLVARRKRALSGAFAAFWLGIGTYAVAEAFWVLEWAYGGGSLALALLVLQVKIVSIVAAFGGLVTHLVGVYTGSRPAVRWTRFAYLLVLLLVEWTYALRQPIGVQGGEWGIRLVYANPQVEPLWTIMLATLMLPPALGAIAYLSLARVADDPRLRRRILLTGAALLLFFVPTFLAWQAGGWPWWGLTEKLLGAATALVMLGAQLGDEERRLAAAHRAARDETRSRLAERARQLV